MRQIKAIRGTGIIIEEGKYYTIINYNKKRDTVNMMLGGSYLHTFHGTGPKNSFAEYFGKLPTKVMNKHIKVL